MNMMKCKNCNNSIPQESAFCLFCGTKIEHMNNEKTCSNCNQAIPLDCDFCPFCGIAINQTTTNTTKETSFAQQVNNYENNPTKNHYGFTNINQNYKKSAVKKLKHIKISENETVIMLGNIHKRSPSVRFWLWTLFYFILGFCLFYFTHKIESFGSRMFSGKIYYFLGFIKYMDVSSRGNACYYTGEIFIIILICLTFAIIPFLIYICKRDSILQNELVLTNQHIYYYSPHELKPIIIPLINIKAIESTSCTWFNGANRIIISLNNGNTYKIPGLSNAQDFIQAVMKSALDITTDQKENKDI